MTKNEIDTLWHKAMEDSIKDGEIFVRYHFANLVAAKATKKEQDRCCALVFGMCESDNVAQRTVNSIRGKHDNTHSKSKTRTA